MEEVKKKTKKNSRKENALNMIAALSDTEILNSITDGIPATAARDFLDGIEEMKADAAAVVAEHLQAKDSGRNWANTSPVIPALFNNQTAIAVKDIYLGTNTETGEAAIFSLLDGYITPYENEIIECITKFRKDGQITEAGQIYFTGGQLFRAMRHGAKSTRPTEAQKKALDNALEALRRDITFKFNEPLRVWGDFIGKGGTYPILNFSRVWGRKINGNESDTMYFISSDMNIVNDISERLHMGQSVSQEVKGILKDGKAWRLYDRQINLRNYLFNRVISYIGARRAGKNFSPCIPYENIFTACNVSTHRETQKRAKNDIAVILNYWQSIGIISSWKEYTNADSTKPDGVEIRAAKEVLRGDE